MATARLTIDSFHTTLTITDGSARDHVNVLVPWVDQGFTAAAQAAADKELADRGWTRAGGWAADPSDGDVSTATIHN